MAAANNVVKLSADVATVIETLQDLSHKLKDNELSFAESFRQNSQNVIDAIRELNKVRVHAHQLLEGETITASALRHKLNSHVSKLQAEAATAVVSARDSNKARLEELQTKITSMSEEANTLLKKHEVLGLHNDVLLPELTQLHDQHNDKVKILNERMLEKAGMQIVLNETIEEMNETDSMIDNLEEETLSLKEKLRLKREAIGKEKEEVLKNLDITRAKFNEKTEENKQLIQNLNDQEYAAVASEISLKETKEAIKHVQDKIEGLLEREKELKKIINDQEKEKQSLIQEGIKIKEEMKKATGAFAIQKKQGEETINQLLTEVELSLTESKRLASLHRTVKAEWTQAKDTLDSVSHSLASIKESVTSAKESLMKESEDGVKLEMEKKEIEFRLEQLEETHKVNVQLLNEEINDLRDRLTRESKNRQAVEDNYNNLRAQIQHQLLEQNEAISTLTSQLRNSKTTGQALSEQREELQKNLRQCEIDIQLLTTEKNQLETHLTNRKSELEEQLTTLECNIAELTDDIRDCTEQLQELEPRCESLEHEHTTLSEQYEGAKKTMIELKNKRAGLNDTCIRIQRELEKMHIPRAHLKRETLKCRAYTRQSLRSQKHFVEDLEEKVKSGKMKLDSIIWYNDKVKHKSEEVEKDCQSMVEFIERSAIREKELIDKLDGMKRELDTNWERNKKLSMEYHNRDSQIVATLSTLQETSSQQMTELSLQSAQFDQEMKNFNLFLSKLANPCLKKKT